MCRVITFVSLSCLLALAACGSSRPATRAPRPAEAEPAPVAKKALAWDGPSVALGQEFSILGWNAMGVKGADMVIYLRSTDWTELEMEGSTVREGTAQLTVTTGEGERDLDVEIGGRVTVGPYEIECRDAADGIDEHGRTVPTVKLYVRRAAK